MSALTPEILSLLIQYPCVVDNCTNRQDHWTPEHICQKCGGLGHSDGECGSKKQLKLMKLITRLQAKQISKAMAIYDETQKIGSSKSHSRSNSTEESRSFDECTPLIKY